MKSKIIGHDRQLSQLEKDMECGNLAHAYLFVGEDHLGKLTAARRMAEILQHGGVKGLDTVELTGREDSLKIEEVRKLTERAHLSSQSAYNIVIIQNIERMTIPAANSFLKTLEEPPGRTVFFLTTSSLSLLLPTIASRARIVKFAPVKDEVLAEFLRTKGVGQEGAQVMITLAAGKPGRIFSFLEKGEEWSEHLRAFEEGRALTGGYSVYEKFEYVDKFLAENRSAALLLEILTAIFRGELRERGSDKALKALSKIREAGILLGQNVNLRLVLENLMLQL